MYTLEKIQFCETKHAILPPFCKKAFFVSSALIAELKHIVHTAKNSLYGSRKILKQFSKKR